MDQSLNSVNTGQNALINTILKFYIFDPKYMMLIWDKEEIYFNRIVIG